MSTDSITVRGTRLAYSDEGPEGGPIVVSAHGLMQSREADRSPGLIDWGGLTDAGFRLISYDARGHGESGGTADSDDYLWPHLADDLLALIDHVSPDAPVRAFGISMGTATILTALTKAPSRFAAIALGAPPTAWQTRGAQGELYDQMAGLVEANGKAALVEAFHEGPVPPVFADLPDDDGEPTPSEALLPSVLRGAGRSDLPAPDALRGIPTPALILAWATDPGHPVSTSEALHDLLPASTLHVSQTSADVRTWATRAAAFFA